MALPERLRTRLRIITSESMMSTKPAPKEAMVVVPVAPWAPLMMAMPPSAMFRSSMVRLPLMLKAMCRPLAS